MAIAEWYTGKVPEDQHKTPLLIVHIPIIQISNVQILISDPAYQVVTMASSAFEHAFAYKK